MTAQETLTRESPCPATVGTRAPDFALPCTAWPDAAERQVSLADYRDRWLVLLFYPRDFLDGLPHGAHRAGSAVRGVPPARLRPAGHQHRLGRHASKVDRHAATARGARRAGVSAGQRRIGGRLPGLRRVARTAARSLAGPVHHRSQRRAAIPGRAQPERGTPQRRSIARARRPANRRAVPRKLEPRRRPRSTPPACCGPTASWASIASKRSWAAGRSAWSTRPAT